jgi:hypothetical protein
MANKNTLRKRRSREKACKNGACIDTSNNHKWKGEKTPNYAEVVAEIRAVSKRLYGQSA